MLFVNYLKTHRKKLLKQGNGEDARKSNELGKSESHSSFIAELHVAHKPSNFNID